jgi:hypothetical protein
MRAVLLFVSSLALAGTAAACPPMPDVPEGSPGGDAGTPPMPTASAQPTLDAAPPPVAVVDAAPPPTAQQDDAGQNTASDAGGLSAAFSCSKRTVTLSGDVEPILARNCSGIEGCHFGIRTPAGAYTFLMAAAAKCTDGRKNVAPSDPSHSYVVDKLTNSNLCGGSGPMPKARRAGSWQSLPTEEIQTIYDWICEGAPNN